jgi:hypothetical protein
MIAQRKAGLMVRSKSVDRMSDTELRQYLDDVMVGLDPEEQARVMAEYTRPLEPDVDATSGEVNGEAPASTPEHEGPEPAHPRSRDRTRSAPTSAGDTDLDRALNKLARNVNANRDQQRYTYGQETVNGESSESDYDDSDDAQIARALLAHTYQQPESQPHTTYELLNAERRRLLPDPRSNFARTSHTPDRPTTSTPRAA